MKKDPARVTIPHRDNQPSWYCVATKFGADGKIESEIVTDETTRLPIAIEIPDKPLDTVFETATATIYYTYHDSYEEARRQMEQSMSMVSPPISKVVRAFTKCCHSSIGTVFKALTEDQFSLSKRWHSRFCCRSQFFCDCS